MYVYRPEDGKWEVIPGVVPINTRTPMLALTCEDTPKKQSEQNRFSLLAKFWGQIKYRLTLRLFGLSLFYLAIYWESSVQ